MSHSKNNLSERSLETVVEQVLVGRHSYISRPYDSIDKLLCVDGELTLKFFRKTQPDALARLEEQYGSDYTMALFERINDQVKERGILSVMRDGVTDRGVRIRLSAWKPETSHNPEAKAEYEANILSVVRQVRYSVENENSIDLVICLNGFPLFTCELKNRFTGQNVMDAIRQYKSDRDPREPLLAHRRCLTHFAVDDEQVFMTTKLEGMLTRFLPFNKGDKGSSGNPVVEGKFKTSYLWEEVWERDSVLDLLANFAQEEVVEKEDAKGRKRREHRLIFPRYHQMDAVRRLAGDALDYGPGRNYLIQHSAGSGKSNTIAWSAHRLSELHNKENYPVFDTVVVVTDRRVLDRQLASTVNSFAQVTGVVRSVTSSAELREALEAGARIVTTTLQKFPVIVDAAEKIAGKNFAVIVDEAHSSQSGESAADLRQVLTLEDAAREQERQDVSMKTTEDMLLERMKARRVKTPNVSFLAFTATPKQKTLELFGVEDPTTRKFHPFSLYSMKQAIEEGFILDVLQSYTTYETYFGLLKKVEDDPEFKKKKAQRLLVGYVERHEHAIDRKVAAMVEHFEEKIVGEIGGTAKAMIVTKSRLHAVRYKLAFDRYLQEKGYPHRALVAFSGAVTDGGKDYSEPGMNGVPEAQTAEEFKHPDCKFLIVAEKFQTGFDQPLLTAMYVDKKLGGVNAVQTLSRLNRTTPGKEGVFVLDFVNTTDEIKDAFQPYYTATVLSEATDPNILHDLERDILQFKLFSDFEVSGFVEDFLHAASPGKLNAAIDAVVARASNEKTPEELDDFRAAITDYLRKYAFVSQIVTFEDPNLERLFIFLKYLAKKLPKRKDPLPYEVLEAVDMESYKIQRVASAMIGLGDIEGALDPMSARGDAGGFLPDESDALSRIIKEINDRYGTNFSESDRVILSNLGTRLVANESLGGSVKNNSRDAAKIKFDEIFQDELVSMLNSHFELYKKLDENPELKKFVNERLFELVVKKLS